MMMYRTLLLLPLLCVGATDQKRIVHRIVEKKNWWDAQTFCRQHHTDLLTIRNQGENEEITHDGWIGLCREKGSSDWKWSSGHLNDNAWINAIPIEFGKRCGYKTAGDKWESKDCSEPHSFYCEDEFILVEQEKPWEEALEHCRNLPQYHPTVDETHRYDLASLTLDNFYSQDIFPAGVNKVWIVLRYLGDQWYWLNGQQHDDSLHCSYFNRCGTLEVNTTINFKQRNCDRKFIFLCSRKSAF